MFEIWVYSPRVEGVHLRAGQGRARRPALVRSPRRLPHRGPRADEGAEGEERGDRARGRQGRLRREAAAEPIRRRCAPRSRRATGCSSRRLLDVTDNLVDGSGESHVVPPDRSCATTATTPISSSRPTRAPRRSPTSPTRSRCARGFWLGDAFASGGAHGYDHKAMGITARGAWESVKRHFRHLDIDPDRDDFTVVGHRRHVGRRVRQRHAPVASTSSSSPRSTTATCSSIPIPIAARSFAERKRLFELPRSSWADYDAVAHLARAAACYPRTLKSIPITPEVRDALAIADDVDALHARRADSRDPARAGRPALQRRHRHLRQGAHRDATPTSATRPTTRCASTAASCAAGRSARAATSASRRSGRVEYALQRRPHQHRRDRQQRGRRHLRPRGQHQDPARRRGARRRDRRSTSATRCSISMTDEVGDARAARQLPPEPRPRQRARAQSAEMEEVHARFMRSLEATGDLDRTVERLPERRSRSRTARNAGLGLTVPELAVLLAYAKITLEEELLASALPDDPDFLPELVRAFPTAVRERFLDRIRTHPLRREITATALVNGLVNRAGHHVRVPHRRRDRRVGPDIVRAHEAARAIFDQDALWREIEALDAVVERRRADRDVPREPRGSWSGARAGSCATARSRFPLRRRSRSLAMPGRRGSLDRWPRHRAIALDGDRGVRRRRVSSRGLARKIAALDHLPARARRRRTRGRAPRRGRARRRRLRRGRRTAAARLARRPHRRARPRRPLGRAWPATRCAKTPPPQHRRIVDAVMSSGIVRRVWVEATRPRRAACRRCSTTSARPRRSTTRHDLSVALRRTPRGAMRRQASGSALSRVDLEDRRGAHAAAGAHAREADAAAAPAQLVHRRDDHARAGGTRPGGRASSPSRSRS